MARDLPSITVTFVLDGHKIFARVGDDTSTPRSFYVSIDDHGAEARGKLGNLLRDFRQAVRGVGKNAPPLHYTLKNSRTVTPGAVIRHKTLEV